MRALLVLALSLSACSPDAARHSATPAPQAHQTAASTRPPEAVLMQPSGQTGIIIGHGEPPPQSPTVIHLAPGEAPPALVREGTIVIAAPTPPPREPTRQERFERNCTDHAEQWRQLDAQYGPIGGNGATGVMDRERWATIPRGDRNIILWRLVFRASCTSGRPGTWMVRMLDRRGQLLARQSMSTVLECHGDHAKSSPDWTEYLC
jgi:hypothetical protein